MKTHTTPKNSRNILTFSVLAVGFIATSFALGTQTSSTVQPFTLIEAGGNTVTGDLNNDGETNNADVILALEMVAGYKPVTPEAYEADPNHDGRITIDDAIELLRSL